MMGDFTKYVAHHSIAECQGRRKVNSSIDDDERSINFDLVVIGGGPSGMAAAIQADKCGLSVAILDERPTLGGQIYKQLGVGFEIHSEKNLGRDMQKGRALIRKIENSAIAVFLKSVVADVEDKRILFVQEDKIAHELYFKRLLIAPGAYDRPVTFPGWTLPGVITAGGAQTLVKTQRILPGRRILFAGSGPLALAFPAQLSNYGANLVATLESAPPPRLGDIARLIIASPGNWNLLRDAIFYRFSLLKHRVPVKYNRIVVSAEGDGKVERVTHAAVGRDWRPIPGTEQVVAVDTLCVGYGFVPSVELFRLANCAFKYDENKGGPTVSVDQWGRTSIPHIFASGDGAGVEGVYVAMARGRLSAIKIAVDLALISESEGEIYAKDLRKELSRRLAFQRVLNRMFSIGPGIFELSDDATIVCRCENVQKSEIMQAIDATADPSVIKGITRAGMGLCQGRNCQSHIIALISKKHKIPMDKIPRLTPRFPVKPISLGAIADATVEDSKFFIDVE
jgi:thioredoxin reductase